MGAALFAVVGFTATAFGSAWLTYQNFAAPWRKLHVEHQGVRGKPSHTRIVVENPKVAVQAVDLASTSDGASSLARITLKNGDELTMTFDGNGRPASITGPDGSVARLAYAGGQTRVTFYSDDGSEVGSKRITVPALIAADAIAIEASPAAAPPLVRRASDAVARALDALTIDEAHADEADDEEITVTREIPLSLDVRVGGPDDKRAGTAQISASCAPLACVATHRDIAVPGANDVVIVATGKVKKKTLAAPSDDDVARFHAEADAERKAAAKDLPKIARVIGGLATTSMAWRSLSLTGPVCVKAFGDPYVPGGAVTSLLEYAVPSSASAVDARAKDLAVEDQARAAFDKDMRIEACVNRDGFARTCVTVPGRPFGESSMDAVSRAIDLAPAVGGTLSGSFVITQLDGSDCTFSPSPVSQGPFKLTFDDKASTASASFGADAHGTRPNLTCSLGTANMSWSQNYNVSAVETFTKEQLDAGGDLPLELKGSMTGSGGYSFSNCRSGGSSVSCPGGKNDGYSYPVEIRGSINLTTHTGTGEIIVHDAPLSTHGTWRVPAEAKP